MSLVTTYAGKRIYKGKRKYMKYGIYSFSTNQEVILNKAPFYLTTNKVGFETATSGESKCMLCKDKIFKGDLRGYYNFVAPVLKRLNKPDIPNYSMKRFFCRDCMADVLKGSRDYYKECARRFSKLNKAWKRSLKGKRVTKIDNAARTLIELKKGNGNDNWVESS